MQGSSHTLRGTNAPNYLQSGDPGTNGGGTLTRQTTDLTIDDYANIFGPSARDIKEDLQKYKRHGRWHIPDILKGRNEYLTERVDGLITDATNSPFTTSILPYKYMENPDGKIKWNVWSFDEGMATRVPYESAARTLTQTKRSYAGYTVRQGMAIKLEHNFMMTPEGRLNFQRQLNQMIGSIQYTNDFDVHVALILAPSYAKIMREKFFVSDDRSPEQLARSYVDMYGFIQKNPNALDILIEEAKTVLKTWGSPPPTFMLCNSNLTFQLTMTPEKTQYITQGWDGVKRLRDGPELASYRGVKIIHSRHFSTETGGMPRDLMRRRVRVAEFYRIKADPMNKHRKFQFYNEGRDGWVTFTWADLIRAAKVQKGDPDPRDPRAPPPRRSSALHSQNPGGAKRRKLASSGPTWRRERLDAQYAQCSHSAASKHDLPLLFCAELYETHAPADPKRIPSIIPSDGFEDVPFAKSVYTPTCVAYPASGYVESFLLAHATIDDPKTVTAMNLVRPKEFLPAGDTEQNPIFHFQNYYRYIYPGWGSDSSDGSRPNYKEVAIGGQNLKPAQVYDMIFALSGERGPGELNARFKQRALNGFFTVDDAGKKELLDMLGGKVPLKPLTSFVKGDIGAVLHANAIPFDYTLPPGTSGAKEELIMRDFVLSDELLQALMAEVKITKDAALKNFLGDRGLLPHGPTGAMLELDGVFNTLLAAAGIPTYDAARTLMGQVSYLPGLVEFLQTEIEIPHADLGDYFAMSKRVNEEVLKAVKLLKVPDKRNPVYERIWCLPVDSKDVGVRTADELGIQVLTMASAKAKGTNTYKAMSTRGVVPMSMFDEADAASMRGIFPRNAAKYQNADNSNAKIFMGEVVAWLFRRIYSDNAMEGPSMTRSSLPPGRLALRPSKSALGGGAGGRSFDFSGPDPRDDRGGRRDEPAAGDGRRHSAGAAGAGGWRDGMAGRGRRDPVGPGGIAFTADSTDGIRDYLKPSGRRSDEGDESSDDDGDDDEEGGYPDGEGHPVPPRHGAGQGWGSGRGPPSSDGGDGGGGPDDETDEYEIVIIRPNIEHHMLGIILGRGGDELGHTYWGQTELSCYDDSMHGIWGMSYKYHERAVVHNERNLVRLWDIAYDGYCGGKDDTFVEWLARDANARNHPDSFKKDTNERNMSYKGVSMMVMAFKKQREAAAPANWPSPIVFYPHTKGDGIMVDEDGQTFNGGKEYQVFEQDFYRDRFGQYKDLMPHFNMLTSVRKDAGSCTINGETTTNALAFQGTMQTIEPGGAVTVVNGSGHHGIDYVGVASVRNGKGHRFQSQPGQIRIM